MIRRHPRIRNPSIHLQLKPPGDESGGPPDRYRLARCGNPNLGFVDPVPPSGRIRFHPRIKNPSIHLRLQQIGGKDGGTPGRYRPPRCGNPSQGFVEPAPPGEDNIPSPDHKSFHTSTKLTNRGRKRWSPGRYRPARFGNPNLGFVDPAPPWEDKIPSSDQKSFHTFTTTINRGRKRWSPGSITPRTMWKLQFVEPATPRENKVPSPDHKSFHTSTTPPNRGQTGDKNPRVDTAPHGVETPMRRASHTRGG